MKRAFTLVELMVAAVISGIILTALFVALNGVWRLARDANEELQAMMKATAQREKLLTGTTLANGQFFPGLYDITNRVSTSGNDLKIKAGGRQLFSTTVDLVRGKNAKGSGGVWIDENPNGFVSYGSQSQGIFKYYIQDVTVYLWVEMPSGTLCRMPVRMPIISQD